MLTGFPEIDGVRVLRATPTPPDHFFTADPTRFAHFQ